MHFSATFFVFLWKHYKRLLFSWKKVFLSTLISSLLFFGILSFGKSQDPPAQSLQLFSALDQTEINGYFPTGIENKICYVPNKAEFEDLMEDVRMKLEEVVSDRKFIDCFFAFFCNWIGHVREISTYGFVIQFIIVFFFVLFWVELI